MSRQLQMLLNFIFCAELPYGDQALFVSRCKFDAVGGFPDFLLMEDYELVSSNISSCNVRLYIWQKLLILLQANNFMWRKCIKLEAVMQGFECECMQFAHMHNDLLLFNTPHKDTHACVYASDQP